MKKLNKKGFTIVELVIVIAVIAILAAVLIPTFSNIIKKAQISADTQVCRNMNTALATAQAEGQNVTEFSTALAAIFEAGYDVAKLNPTTNGYRYIWSTETNQMLFVDCNEDTWNVVYPEGTYTLNNWKCYSTAKTDEEATLLKSKEIYSFASTTKTASTEKILATTSLENPASFVVDKSIDLRESKINNEKVWEMNPLYVGNMVLLGNTYTATKFSTIVVEDGAYVGDGTMVAYAVNGTDKGSYALVILAEDVTVKNVTLKGGISVGAYGGDNSDWYGKHAKNLVVENCDITAQTSGSSAICVQGGSCESLTIKNCTIRRDAAIAGDTDVLIYICGSKGDMGDVGDVNAITFENVICETDPFKNTTTLSGADAVQFEITGDVDGTRNVVAKTSYASSTLTVVKNADGTWTLNGTTSYTIH